MKIVPKSKLTYKEKDTLDSLKRYKGIGSKREMDILYRAKRSWDALYDIRTKRERLMKYTYGDQYIDMVEVDGELKTEAQYWEEQGILPKKNNLLRKMVRSIIGVYKNQDTDFTVIARDRDEQSIGEMFTITLQANRDLNRMGELEIRLLEEFLISGTIFVKESWGWRKNTKDTWTDIVNPNYIFYDGVMQDVRHWDCDIIGQIHDMYFNDVCSLFATNKSDYEKLREIYANAMDERFMSSYYQNIYYHGHERGDFFIPLDPSMCRVIEIWSKEQKPRYHCHDYLKGDYYKIEIEDLPFVEEENRKRLKQGMDQGIPKEDIPFIEVEWFIDNYWYYRFLSPLGDVLQEGESPFSHKEHPYTIKIYPFIDGKPHSFIEDSIDQQKFINELITLYMLMARSSAKGLLMFPEDLLGMMSIEEIADEYAKVNGMIVYKPKAGVPLPQQLSTNVSNFNVSELLKMEIKMFEDVTGVTGAMQGKDPISGTAASLYAQQTQNAINSLVDVLSSFGNFLKEAMIKKLSNIQQYYTDERNIIIAGSQYGGIKKYMPHLGRDCLLDVIVTEGMSTPQYKQAMNAFLLELYKAQGITLEQLFEFGDFPNGDNILQKLRQEKENIERENSFGQAQVIKQ